MAGSDGTAVAWCLAILFWVLAAAASLVASQDYTVPVTIALASAVAHWFCAGWLRRKTNQRGRVVLLALTAVLIVLTVDNIGRVLHMAGGPLFRLL